MSYRKDKIMSLAGLDSTNLSKKDLVVLFNELLDKGVHGICFSPYINEQGPGTIVSEEQIEKRLAVIKPYTKWVRTFSCTEGNENIPRLAKKQGLKTMVGAWLGNDAEINENEIANVIKIVKDGHADMVAVGNEVLYRGDLSENELLAYIQRVKKEVNDVPVGYVDAYYQFEHHPLITEECDVIFANCYPFWEGCHMDYSLLYMRDMYNRAIRTAKGKKVIISETGWPNKGTSFGQSSPSFENALRYFINTQIWSSDENIDVFYFSSFDESWKVGAEGDVGAYWGIWDKDGILKYSK